MARLSVDVGCFQALLTTDNAWLKTLIMTFIYAHSLKEANLILSFRSYTGILLELMILIMVNHFSLKNRFSYIKSLKTYLGKFTYLLYCRFNGYKFLVDILQQVMVGFDKLSYAQVHLNLENFMKIICLIKIRRSTTRYYIL